MANKKILFGTLAMVLALVFELVLAGCDDGSKDDDNGGGNPFVGTWNGTATLGGQAASATITVTGSNWNMVCSAAGMNESGSYTYSGNTATLKAGNGSTTIGTAVVSGNTLVVTLNANAGSYAGGTGTFTK